MQRNLAIIFAVIFLALAVHQCHRAREINVVKEQLEITLGNMFEPVGGE